MRFTRQQLIIVVDCLIASAIDQLEGCLPPTIPRDEFLERKYLIDEHINSIKNLLGLQIPVLWTQTEGKRIQDGMAQQDFTGWTELENKIDNLVQLSSQLEWYASDLYAWINKNPTYQLAYYIVDKNWPPEYFE